VFKKRIGEFGRVLIRFSSSQLIFNALTLVSGFLVVKLVDPKTYGSFAGYQVYLGYILLMHGGILNGLNRELPYLLGKGDNKYSEELVASANLLTLVIGIISSFVFSLRAKIPPKLLFKMFDA
jgi:O-antigen/teichoic acid export membrane protein